MWPLKAEGTVMVGRTREGFSRLCEGVFQPPGQQGSLVPQGLSQSGDAQQAIGWAGCRWGGGRQQLLALRVQWECGHQGWRGLQSQCGPHVTCRAGNGSPVCAGSTCFTAYELYSNSGFCVKDKAGWGCKVAEGPRLGEATPEVLHPGCLPWNLHDKLCLLPCPPWPLLNNIVLTLKVCYS